MWKKAIVLAAAACAALVTVPAPATATAALGESTKPLRLRAGLTLKVPATWKTVTKGDWTRVITGKCAQPQGGYFTAECKSFWVLGPKVIKFGDLGTKPYDAEQPFYPSSDVSTCPQNRKYVQVHGKATAIGYRKVGDRKAHYRSWPGRCVVDATGEHKFFFTQREWFLPRSGVLIVDQWRTPGLAAVLGSATWG
ncbi:hypothetical protein [Sinosporangium siamense]|uniref:Uncharacterized protein n=1 Tax=Sinosporangium siamense TaxID=1367973 RepID=A0A919RJ24_9ACTN|nr:hypothetical protein [Sinosporangium siamense]GII94780.1 hypothetical protein Ssi02_50110 [Sinosporangium siamense]